MRYPFEYRKLGDFTYHELMDGYTRYAVLQRHEQKEVYAYVGTTGVQSAALTGEAVSKGLPTLAS